MRRRQPARDPPARAGVRRPAPQKEILYGGGGDDRIDGGPGFDGIYAQGGDDWVSVGPSQPWPIADNPAVQWAFGGTGKDTLRADGGRASFYGDYDDDRVLGGRFADRLVGGLGNDVLLGYAGPDALHGRGGADDLFGYTGNDLLLGGDGRNENYGGTGVDRCRNPHVGADAHSCERRL